jgi:hypothetical protein
MNSEQKAKLSKAFWQRVKPLSSGCWQWNGFVRADGYGDIGFTESRIRAHRLGWLLLRGEIPEGMELDHLCRNHRCVNPAHLEPVTHKENLFRGEGISAKYVKRTECSYGHPLSGDNLVILPNGARRCQECHRNYEYARKRRLNIPARTRRGPYSVAGAAAGAIAGR